MWHIISIGSNIAPEQNIVAAIALLRRYTTVLAISPVYLTEPQGHQCQASFLNMAAKVHTLRSPDDFKTAVLDRIEAELERVRDPANRNAPRTIDLDISLWNDAVIQYGAKALAGSRTPILPDSPMSLCRLPTSRRSTATLKLERPCAKSPGLSITLTGIRSIWTSDHGRAKALDAP